jgi:hypothetical protein
MKTHFSALSDDHQLRGALIIGYKTALNSEEFASFFEAHGLQVVDADRWYPAQQVLDVFNDMMEASHGFLDFVSIGIAAVPNMRFPPTVDLHSPESVLAALPTIPDMMVRSSRPGYAAVEPVSAQCYRIKVRSTMPDDIIYGTLYALAKGFVADPTTIVLSYPPDAKRRDYGDEYTNYELRWG